MVNFSWAYLFSAWGWCTTFHILVYISFKNWVSQLSWVNVDTAAVFVWYVFQQTNIPGVQEGVMGVIITITPTKCWFYYSKCEIACSFDLFGNSAVIHGDAVKLGYWQGGIVCSGCNWSGFLLVDWLWCLCWCGFSCKGFVHMIFHYLVYISKILLSSLFLTINLRTFLIFLYFGFLNLGII